MFFFSDSTMFRSASLSFLPILASISALYLPNFSADITSSWCFPYILAYFLNYAIPPFSSSPLPCVTFSHTALSTMDGNLFFGMFLALYCHFNFLMSLFVFSGYIPSSALNTVLLVVLDPLGSFLAAVICTEAGGTIVHDCSRMTIGVRFPTMPGRSTSGFIDQAGHCLLHQVRSAGEVLGESNEW